MNTHCRYLVFGVGKKKSRPVLAEEFYTPNWFLKARADVESTELTWFMLSAEHGLLSPGPASKIAQPAQPTPQNTKRPPGHIAQRPHLHSIESGRQPVTSTSKASASMASPSREIVTSTV